MGKHYMAETKNRFDWSDTKAPGEAYAEAENKKLRAKLDELGSNYEKALRRICSLRDEKNALVKENARLENALLNAVTKLNWDEV